jgi:hypothetical protein
MAPEGSGQSGQEQEPRDDDDAGDPEFTYRDKYREGF